MWELDCEESWAPKNWCFWTVVLEKILESPLDCKEIQPVQPKGDQPWDFFGSNDAEAGTPILWPPHEKSWLIGKRLWCCEGLGAGGEGDDRGWDGWMASPTPWTWVWVNSRSGWWTGRPGVLQFMGSQTVGHDWATELNLSSNNLSHLWLKITRIYLTVLEAKSLKSRCWGNSLAVQWWELHASIAGGRVSIPGQGTKTPQDAWPSQKINK